MKIAAYHNLPHGGALRTFYEQVKGLSKKHEVDLYEIQKGKYRDLKEYVNKTYLYEFKIDNNLPGLLNRLLKDYRNFVSLYFHNKKIAEIIDKRDYDVVLVQSCMWTESPFILRFLRTPNLFDCHELLRIAYEKVLEFDEDVSVLNKIYESVTRKLRKYIDKANAKSAYKIITNSYFIKGKVKKAYGRDAIVSHHCVDTKIFKRINDGKNKNQLLFIGGKHKPKGYDLVRKAVDLVDKGIRPKLITLGFGKEDVYVKSDRQLAIIYSESLATICPAREEPFGLVPLESMACETPVLAVNEGGYKETVVDGKTGYLLKRDPKAFAGKIKYLVTNPDVARKMGREGRKHVKKNFCWAEHVNKVEKVLLSIK